MSNKTFSTITLRNLDSEENTDVVEILNDYMKETGVKTGQSAIEGIIRKYYKLVKRAKDLQAENTKLDTELTQTKRNWEAEKNALTTTLTSMQTYLADVETLKQGGIGALIEAQKNRNQQSRPFSAASTYSPPAYNSHQDDDDEDDYDDEEDEEYEDEEEYDDEED